MLVAVLVVVGLAFAQLTLSLVARDVLVVLYCIFVHDVFNNKAPRNISSLFTLVSDAHLYNTRFSQASTFAIQNSRTHEQRIKSFSCSVAKAWNCIPLSIRSLSKQKFKAAIHDHCQLVDILLFEDDYMLTRLLLPLDLNSFEVWDISHFV